MGTRDSRNHLSECEIRCYFRPMVVPQPATTAPPPGGRVTHPPDVWHFERNRSRPQIYGGGKKEERFGRRTRGRTTLSFSLPLCLFLSYRSQMYLPPAITQSRKEEEEPNSLFYASASGRSTLGSKFLKIWTTNHSEYLAFFRHVFFERTRSE